MQKCKEPYVAIAVHVQQNNNTESDQYNHYILVCLFLLRNMRDQIESLARVFLPFYMANGQYSITEYQQQSLNIKHVHAYI